MLPRWKSRPQDQDPAKDEDLSESRTNDAEKEAPNKRPRWNLGILADKQTDEVPGSVLLLSKVYKRNEPLGLEHTHARTSHSSLPSPYVHPSSRSSSVSRAHNDPPRRRREPEKKRTDDGKIILDPQPDDSPNDPLNWPMWRRDSALLSLGLYCMLGGGMTPILAAGFNNVASTYGVTVPQVALTTGLYMMGLGVGCVIMSPTAILFGKRPVYLATTILFILSSVWCALSPNYTSLLIARIVQGIAVSPVECLPSATVAEIFFLHERAYRLGIYTLLLLGGKNLVPLVSAAIIQRLDWRWVFWIVAIIVGFCAILLFLFVPETFWDRTPRPRHMLRDHHRKHSRSSVNVVTGAQNSRPVSVHHPGSPETQRSDEHDKQSLALTLSGDRGLAQRRLQKTHHVDFVVNDVQHEKKEMPTPRSRPTPGSLKLPSSPSMAQHDEAWKVEPMGGAPVTPFLHNLNSPFYIDKVASNVEPEASKTAQPKQEEDYFSLSIGSSATPTATALDRPAAEESSKMESGADLHRTATSASSHGISQAPVALTSVLPSPSSVHGEKPRAHVVGAATPDGPGTPGTGVFDGPAQSAYTEFYRQAPPKSFVHSLKPYSGRLCRDNWFKVAVRPFVLFSYPAVLWSSLIYALSVGWLIVLSESVSTIYRNRESYNFTALQVGLVYLSPFIGGILGTAVAGKVSDVIVRFMSRRNDGVYEPEFRLVMAIPIAITTTIGLMGFGWSAEEKDKWIVPTIFFGLISFGCSLGSTTSITFCVDSYRQYAGEALVTLNFSKNVFHGLVFSLFFTHWLEGEGSKTVFLSVGGIQLACLLFTIPMYMFGKRARMWTVRKNLMERF